MPALKDMVVVRRTAPKTELPESLEAAKNTRLALVQELSALQGEVATAPDSSKKSVQQIYRGKIMDLQQRIVALNSWITRESGSQQSNKARRRDLLIQCYRFLVAAEESVGDLDGYDELLEAIELSIPMGELTG